MTQGSSASKDLTLLQTLVEQKLITEGQASVAKADLEASGLSIADVLLARRWVSEETLARFAPWLNEPVKLEKPASVTADDGTYQENLKKYKRLISQILGEEK